MVLGKNVNVKMGNENSVVIGMGGNKNGRDFMGMGEIRTVKVIPAHL